MLKVLIIGYDKMLAALIGGTKAAGHKIVGVMRNDRVKYSNFALFFKDIFAPSSDFSYIKSYNLYDIKAPSVNSAVFLKEIKKLKPDVILVGSWSEKFSNKIINFPKYGVVNVHPSLLPRHRGANPYFWAIYTNEERTGVTFHKMTEKLDAGDILMQAAFKIDFDMTGGKLKNKTCKVAEIMTKEFLEDLEDGSIIPIEQDEIKATYDKYPFEGIDIIKLDDMVINIYNHIRALTPWGYCHCNIENTVYKIKQCKIVAFERSDNIEIGKIVKKKDKNLLVKCADGIVELDVF